jgi:hypothetical protein
MSKSGFWARLAESRADRRQKRTWRKERRKGSVNADDARSQAHSGMYKKGGYFTKN